MKTKLQNKWRLPTVEEFENVLYPNRYKIPNLKKYSPYWSSAVYSNLFAWGFKFHNCETYAYDSKYRTIQVRPVRNVSSDSTNSSNSTIIRNLEVYNQDLDRTNWQKALVAINKLNYE
jgi:hypothetical protein